MFKLEIINLLNSFKKSNNSIESDAIKNKIIDLISHNRESYLKFIKEEKMNEDVLNFLKTCYNSLSVSNSVVETKNGNNVESETEVNNYSQIQINEEMNIIQNKFEEWQQIYKINNNVPNNENEKIVLEIINFYILNRFEVLEKILNTTSTLDFEAFKQMLKNYIRIYFVEKIDEYYKSSKFESLNFFSKKKKKRKIMNFLKNIGQYVFDKKEFEEIVK